MTRQSPAVSATFPARRLRLLAAVTVGVVLALAFASTVAHAPDWGLLARQPLVIQLHIAAALAAAAFAAGLATTTTPFNLHPLRNQRMQAVLV